MFFRKIITIVFTRVTNTLKLPNRADNFNFYHFQKI